MVWNDIYINLKGIEILFSHLQPSSRDMGRGSDLTQRSGYFPINEG